MSAPEIVLFHGLLAELCTDICLDMHRVIWMGEFEQGQSVSSFLHDSQRVQQMTRSHEKTAPPFNPLGATPAPQLQCLNCGKAVNAKKLAPHLEKVSNDVHLCLGLLFNPPNWCHLPISSISNRRSALKNVRESSASCRSCLLFWLRSKHTCTLACT